MKEKRQRIPPGPKYSSQQAVLNWGGNIPSSPVFQQEKDYPQHGIVSCYDHSLSVARLSLAFAQKARIGVDAQSMVRGALLHDLFLYDWHIPDRQSPHRLHGFFHPRRALRNAQTYFSVNHLERDIILKHMFPLTIIPPLYRESWLVCAADTVCAVREWAAGRRRKND